jgi:hypothetical protein
MSEHDNGEHKAVTPDAIFQIATGFMAAKHLFVASEIGLFAGLSGGPLSLDDLAPRLATPRRTLRILADAMVALHLLKREGDLYSNTPVTQAFLSGSGEPDMRPFLRFWNHISYPMWLGLEASIRSGEALTTGKVPTDEENRIFSEGVEAINAGGAKALPSVYDFSKHRRLLNLGGWYVSFLLPVLRRYTSLEATLLMLPQWFDKAGASLAREPEIATRVRLIEGDYLYEELPEGHDLFLMANLIHHFSPAHNTEAFRHIRRYAPAGARLLAIDFFTDPTHTQPVFAALMAGEFQTISGEGDVYSADEVKGWLAESGWRAVDYVHVDGPLGMIIADAVEQPRNP